MKTVVAERGGKKFPGYRESLSDPDLGDEPTSRY
jgi:hypothetical protein